MYILLACLSLAVLAYSDDSKHYLKYPAPASIEPAAHPVERKPHDSVGATYQAITKRHYTGAASSSTTAEILNTITSPHSRSSVSFTTTSADHPAEEPPHHPVNRSPAPPHYPVPTPLHHPSPTPLHHSPHPVEHSPPTHTVYNPTPVPPIAHQPTPGDLSPIYHSTPAPHPTPIYYTVSPPPPSHSLPHPSPPSHPLSHPSQDYSPARVLYHSQYPASLAEHPISVPASQHYDLQHIVNDPEHSRTPSTYTYRIPPNQTDDYPPAPRVSPKAFSYQPVITIANNMKSFYKTFNYDPFVVPQPPAPEQYYAGNYLNNLIYPGSEYP
uniref:Uncharacterized protein n=1 Tax=Cacopsylla melanoneura TaxID=428564 RepID=A0A8D8TNX4_9HEMI